MNSQIIEAIKTDKLVFFIGAGFSLPLGYLSWNGLVEKMLDILSKDYKDLSPFKAIIKAENPLISTIDILDFLTEYKDRVYKVMDEEFSAIEDRVKLNPDLLKRHKMISKITSKIITTNYDRSLENANPELRKFTYSNLFNTANLYSMNEYIFKLHGCIEDAASCILYKKDYENLYSDNSQYKGAIEELRKIIGDKTIIFLGFSLSDPYVKYQFNYINTIYKSLKGKHFIISTENIIGLEGVETLKIDNWEEGLDSLLDELYSIKNETSNGVVEFPTKQCGDVSEIETIKIAILVAAPINEKFEFPINKIIKPFLNRNVKIDYYNLTINNLNKLDGYNYILLFTKLFRNSVFIEDEYLIAQSIKLENLQNEILDESVKCIFIFSDKIHKFDTTNIHLPIIIKQYDKQYDTFIFKILKKGMNFNDINLDAQYINSSQILIDIINKGTHTIKNIKTALPSEIDPKQLINFVGRIIDLENICRKILDLNGKILTIKGSGGVGKTTIVKKAVIELSQRGFYQDGIHFIDCQPLRDYETFKYKISQCYNLDNTLDLKEHMINNDIGIDKLIIIDNFESLLDLEDTQEIKQLVTFLCDYASVICTSREWLNFEFEDKYDLRQLTTDECVELFQKYYTNKIEENELKILRIDLIENLLNNNPLAIKIVTSNIPRLKSMEAIKRDLEEDFFNATKLGYEDIFNSSDDSNIEKSKSLYQSINYSYCKLLSKDKLVFELISLFPDGIHMDNFIKVFKNNKNGITGKELKSLEDKSLIQISNARISLQSIVGRFAAHKFNERKSEEKKHYFNQAIDYNLFTINIVNSNNIGNKASLQIYDVNMGNLYHSLNYLDQVNAFDKLKLLNYLINVVEPSSALNNSEKFIKQIYRLKDFFKEIEKAELALELFIIKLKYYMGGFEENLSKLKGLVTLEQVMDLAESDELVDKIIFSSALSVYQYGNEFEIVNNVKVYNESILYDIKNLLFKIGAYKGYKVIMDKQVSIEGETSNNFFDLEILNNIGKLDINVIDKHLSEKTHNKDHLEIMQINYVKAKMGYISKEEVKKLVVVNPYSLGLKNLMFAFLETDSKKAVEYYRRAISNLKHIQYYYVEAMYYYAKYLKKNGLENYGYFEIEGRNVSEKYHYSFLLYKFDCLINDVDKTYIEEEYHIGLNFNPNEYLERKPKYLREKMVTY